MVLQFNLDSSYLTNAWFYYSDRVIEKNTNTNKDYWRKIQIKTIDVGKHDHAYCGWSYNPGRNILELYKTLE